MTTWSTQQVGRIQQLQQMGNFSEAERLCREALVIEPNSPELLSALGVVLSQTGRHDEAIGQLLRATSLAPDNFIHLFNLGTVYAAKEQYKAAEDAFRKVLSHASHLPEGHFNLGNSLKDQGRLDEATAAYRKAIQLRSSYAAAWSNLGSAYIQLTKPADAKAAIQRALALNPSSPSALNNMANIARNEGDLAGALQYAVNALAINPNYADAYFTLGSALIASLDHAKAIIAYEKGASLKPASKAVLSELVNAYVACGVHEGIVKTLERILQLDPADARAHLFLGITQMERGFYEEAARAFKTSLETANDPAVQIRQALSVPPIFESADQIREIRERLEKSLDDLLTKSGNIQDPYSSQLGTNFFLAYHATNNRSIQAKIARVYRQYAPSLNYVASHCAQPRKPNPRIKVGFISKYIFRHSVAISFGKVVSALSNLPDIDAYLISTTDPKGEAVKEMYAGFKGTFVTIPASLPYAQQNVGNIGLDVLIYLDLGMDPLTFLLAFSRLAPVQGVLGGHPDTTGIDTVDYYLSVGAAEPEEADGHYSEKLVRLASGGFSFVRPAIPSSMKSRGELGLPASGNLYLCPMMLQKIHPDFDAAISRILEQDPTGHVVLSESFQHPQWGVLLRQRLDKTVSASVRDRIIFIPWIHNADDFLSALAASSVILDPFHFGMGTTGAMALSVGTPYVTMPGEFLRGRVGLLYCEMLGITECIAMNPEEYAQRAVQIATDMQLRTALKEKILAKNHLLFENKEAAPDLAEFFRSAVAQVTQN